MRPFDAHVVDIQEQHEHPRARVLRRLASLFDAVRLAPEILRDAAADQHAFEMPLDVTEPMGMETLVFFRVNGLDVCARVSPNSGAREGTPMRLAASLDNMHLIDDATGRVI